MANGRYEVGATVKVYFDADEKIPNIGAKRYDGTLHRISKRTEYGVYGALFELEEAVSDMGVPYVFTAKDLILV